MTKQLRLTLIRPGDRRDGALSALVTVARKTSWSATTSVEHDGEVIEHSSEGHADERSALLEAAEWLRTRFGARATMLGSTVTVVGIQRRAEAPSLADARR